VSDPIKAMRKKQLEAEGCEVLDKGFPDLVYRRPMPDGTKSLNFEECKNLSTGQPLSPEQETFARWLMDAGIQGHSVFASYNQKTETVTEQNVTREATRVVISKPVKRSTRRSAPPTDGLPEPYGPLEPGIKKGDPSWITGEASFKLLLAHGLRVAYNNPRPGKRNRIHDRTYSHAKKKGYLITADDVRAPVTILTMTKVNL
jgi:hypothetical protein